MDYTIRELLMTGLKLKALDQEQLDLRQCLLPRSLGGCLGLIRRVREFNELLPIEPEPPLRFVGRQFSVSTNMNG